MQQMIAENPIYPNKKPTNTALQGICNWKNIMFKVRERSSTYFNSLLRFPTNTILRARMYPHWFIKYRKISRHWMAFKNNYTKWKKEYIQCRSDEDPAEENKLETDWNIFIGNKKKQTNIIKKPTKSIPFTTSKTTIFSN